jgi:hypothetical protein
MKNFITFTLILLLSWLSAFAFPPAARSSNNGTKAGGNKQPEATGGGFATIAFDASSAGAGGGAGPHTYAHTTTGSNVVLVVWVLSNGTITSVTYGGNAMTAFATSSTGANAYTVRGYYRAVGSGAGAQNVVTTGNSATDIYVMSASYTGCSQTGVPDANTGGEDPANDFAMTLTTTANSCWLVAGQYDQNGSAQDAGASTTKRQTGAFGGWQLWDSNGTRTPAGSQSLNVSVLGVGPNTWVCVSLKPAAL